MAWIPKCDRGQKVHDTLKLCFDAVVSAPPLPQAQNARQYIKCS